MEIMRATKRFRSTVEEACRAKLPAGNAGGEVEVSLRILADGSVSEACIRRDYVGDEVLRSCVSQQARAYRFPPLGRGDFVNAGLDVSFLPAGLPSRPVCDP
jgi:hypothetical protein